MTLCNSRIQLPADCRAIGFHVDPSHVDPAHVDPAQRRSGPIFKVDPTPIKDIFIRYKKKDIYCNS